MNMVDSFLLFTIFSYGFVAVFPKPVTKNLPYWMEKFFMSISCLVLLLNLIVFNNSIGWMLMGGLWSILACLSYLGYAEWNIAYKIESSDIAQTAMFVWDALIVLCCFLKVPFL